MITSVETTLIIQDHKLSSGTHIYYGEAVVTVECDQADVENGSGWSYEVISVDSLKVEDTDGRDITSSLSDADRKEVTAYFENYEISYYDLEEEGR